MSKSKALTDLLAKIDSNPKMRKAVAKALAEMKAPAKMPNQDSKAQQTARPNG